MAGLPTNQRDQAMLLVGILAIAGAALYWYFVYSPKSEELTRVQVHIDSLEASNRRAKAELAKGSVQDLRAQADLFRRHLEMMRQLVPTSNEVPALLDQVSTAARRAGLELGLVEPEPVIVGPEFDTYRYKMALFGTYHEIGDFLTNVGSLPRIIAPINLQLTPATTDLVVRAARRRNRQALEARFQIQTYVSKTSVEPQLRGARRTGADD